MPGTAGDAANGWHRPCGGTGRAAWVNAIKVSWTTRHRAAAPVLAAGCAVALLGAVESAGWGRPGTCAGSDCVDVYIDRPGRTPRRYCSPACLNRARIRAYRTRHQPQKRGTTGESTGSAAMSAGMVAMLLAML